MNKLIVFDLDGTLAPVGCGMKPETMQYLRELEHQGNRIALCSGKTAYYLCGFVRQIGLRAPILLGENGADTQFGIDLPPAHFYRLPFPEEARAALAELHTRIERAVPGLWYQPNTVILTPVFRTTEERDRIRSVLKESRDLLNLIDVFEHCDSFDLVPKGINKYEGVKALAAHLGLTAEDVIAVGDGSNDLPMFRFAGLSIGITEYCREHVDVLLNGIDEAMDFLLSMEV